MLSKQRGRCSNHEIEVANQKAMLKARDETYGCLSHSELKYGFMEPPISSLLLLPFFFGGGEGGGLLLASSHRDLSREKTPSRWALAPRSPRLCRTSWRGASNGTSFGCLLKFMESSRGAMGRGYP